MLHNIEKVFNRIWSTSGPRRGVSAFLLYWALLSLGPLLLGTAMLMNTYVLSVKLITDEISRSGLSILFSYLPLFLTASAFSLLYTVVPNCKVMLRYAIIGGCVATVGLELAKSGFGYFVSNSSYTSIYGAFATIPIFLLWVYLAWMIILGGAEFVRTSENFGAERRGQWPLHAAAIVALWLFWKAHKSGLEVSESDCRRVGLPSNRWAEVRDQLLQNQIISVTESKNYILLKSLDELTVWAVYQMFPHSLRVPTMVPRGIEVDTLEGLWWHNYKDLIEENEIRSHALMSMTLNELFSAENQPNLPSLQHSNISHISN